MANIDQPDSFQQKLTQYIHLLQFLKPRGSLARAEVTALIRPERIRGNIARQEPLNFISACLAIRSDNRVVVAYAGNELVIAKAGPIGEQDEYRATAVVATLRAISAHNAEQAISTLLDQEFGHTLFQQQVQDLICSISCLATELQVAVEAIHMPKGKQYLDSVDRIRSYASKLGSAGKMDWEDWMALYGLVKETLHDHNSFPSHTGYYDFIELNIALRDFCRWPEAVASLVSYLKGKNVTSLSYRFIPTPTLADPVYLKDGPHTTLIQFASSGDIIEAGYEKFWPTLLEKFQLTDAERLSPFVAVHPEVRLILDLETSTVVGPRIIGSTVNPCVCCTIWIRLFNKRFATAWRCGNDYYDVGTDWASPNSYCRHNLDRAMMREVEGGLFDVVQNMLKTFISGGLEKLDDFDDLSVSDDDCELSATTAVD